MQQKKYISFSLWGEDPMYTVGIVRNAELRSTVYPEWDMVVYHDQSVPEETLKQLTDLDVELIAIKNHPAHPSFWRFFIVDRDDCERAIFRDADSRFSQREALAVDEWERLGTVLHVMRDHPYHKIPFGINTMGILAGMWGIKAGAVQMEQLIHSFIQCAREQEYGVDQTFLKEIYTTFKSDSTVHDEFFDERPFPIKRKGLQFVGERIDEWEQPVGNDWRVLQTHYQSVSKSFFTIIIPTYNAEATIEACLRSVLQQHYTNFEIIVQDGLSTDDTVTIVKDLNDDRISIVSEADHGVYDAMNKALDRSCGEWIFFLGSDDVLYDANVFDHVASYLVDSTHKFVYGDVFMIERHLRSEDLGVLYMGAASDAALLERNICHQAIFYHKDIFNNGYRYRLDYKIFADYDANLYLSSRFERRYIPVTVAKFYLGGLSSTMEDPAFDKDKWTNIVDYFSFKLTDRSFRPYRRRIKKVGLQSLKSGNVGRFLKAYSIFLNLKLIKKW
ncbi:glycosyltransferase family 2 protein [Sphingobacterium suaedae]|uniref:Glycosyltransferase family 2 protein n=1 Tax=Sphingobacterium suaedae TaxID=1686402 RepID=A0ABW5KJL7_9SPHI